MVQFESSMGFSLKGQVGSYYLTLLGEDGLGIRHAPVKIKFGGLG
jgi:hypothetical protein